MRRILFVLGCLFILTSCSSRTENDDSTGYRAIHKMDQYGEASVLYYSDAQIYFYEIEEDKEQSGSDLVLYRYDMSKDRIKEVDRIHHFFVTANSSVSLGDGIAFTVCTKEKDETTNHIYYCKDDELLDIYNWNANNPLSFLNKITEEELLLFYPDAIKTGDEESYTYEIVRVGLNDKKGTEVKSFHYNVTEQAGEIVPAVDLYHNQVYVFKTSSDGGEDRNSICIYDLDGGLADEYQLDIQDFLYLEATSSYDSVYRIKCLENDIFVLQTLNNRIAIYEKVDGELVRVNAPESLSAFPEGYKIAGCFGEGDNEIYFANMFQDHLIKLDADAKEFQELDIVRNAEDSYIRSLDINSEGEILLRMDEQFYVSEENESRFLAEYSLSEPETKWQEEQKDEALDILQNKRQEYELENITERRYERNGSFVEFDDLPENDAETLVCYDLASYHITGSRDKSAEYQYYVPEDFDDSQDEDDETVGKSVYEWIKVAQISTLTFEELKENERYEELFKTLGDKLAPDMELDDYVQMILENGCAVVQVQYSDKYTEDNKLLQVADGEHETYWLLVPDENGQLRIFDSTFSYLLFNVYHEDAGVPEALRVDVR